MPYVGAGKSRLPHSLGDLPTAAESTAMVQAGRRLQSEVCWDAVLVMLGKTATKSAPQQMERVEHPALL